MAAHYAATYFLYIHHNAVFYVLSHLSSLSYKYTTNIKKTPLRLKYKLSEVFYEPKHTCIKSNHLHTLKRKRINKYDILIIQRMAITTMAYRQISIFIQIGPANASPNLSFVPFSIPIIKFPGSHQKLANLHPPYIQTDYSNQYDNTYQYIKPYTAQKTILYIFTNRNHSTNT